MTDKFNKVDKENLQNNLEKKEFEKELQTANTKQRGQSDKISSLHESKDNLAQEVEALKAQVALLEKEKEHVIDEGKELKKKLEKTKDKKDKLKKEKKEKKETIKELEGTIESCMVMWSK